MKVFEIFGKTTTIQTFDDAKQDRPLQRVFLYDEERAKELNEQGAGVFWSVNLQEDGEKRGIENTCQFSCIGMDCDITKETDEKRHIERMSEEEVQSLKMELFNKLVSLPVPPSGMIETRNGLQPYWVFIKPIVLKPEVRKTANIRYQDFIRGFAKATGIASEGDNISRVLRMPGFYHKKSDKPFLIRDIFEEGIACDFEEFKKFYPPITKEGTVNGKKYATSDNPDRLEDVPVQQALEKLSGMGVVNREEYSFRPNSNGTIQILINDKPSSQWIDPEHNTIGGSGEGKGNPTIIQWMAWYYKNKGETNEMAHAKAYQVLFPLLLPHVPEEQWGNPKLKKRATGQGIIIPRLDPEYIAQMLTNPDYLRGVDTRFNVLDALLKGLRKQFVYGVVAASGQGKSIFAVNVLYNVARQGYPVAYFDLENGPILGEKRLLQIHTGWRTSQIDALEKHDSNFITEELKNMEKEITFHRLYDLEASSQERIHMRAVDIIRYLAREKGVRVVCIDNINCFIPDTRNENEYKTELYVTFSKLAIELDISIITIHHATDKLQKKMGYTQKDFEEDNQPEFLIPFLSKALGTSTFIQKINVGMVFAQKRDLGQFWFKVEKNRDGEQGLFKLFFNSANLRLTNNVMDTLYPEKPFPKIGYTEPPAYVKPERPEPQMVVEGVEIIEPDSEQMIIGDNEFVL